MQVQYGLRRVLLAPSVLTPTASLRARAFLTSPRPAAEDSEVSRQGFSDDTGTTWKLSGFHPARIQTARWIRTWAWDAPAGQPGGIGDLPKQLQFTCFKRRVAESRCVLSTFSKEGRHSPSNFGNDRGERREFRHQRAKALMPRSRDPREEDLMVEVLWSCKGDVSACTLIHEQVTKRDLVQFSRCVASTRLKSLYSRVLGRSHLRFSMRVTRCRIACSSSAAVFWVSVVAS